MNNQELIENTIWTISDEVFDAAKITKIERVNLAKELVANIINEAVNRVLGETYDGGSGGMIKVSDVLKVLREMKAKGPIE